MKKLLKKAFLYTATTAILIIMFIYLLNLLIQKTTSKHIYQASNDIETKAQVVMILGALTHKDGILSDIYQDRADTAIKVWKEGKAKKILISADNSGITYDEVRSARDYLVEKGIPENIIFADFAGFDTYDSLYRAKHLFGIKSLIISTQEFHLPRAIWIARNLDIDAYGITADKHTYIYARYNKYRELLANIKALSNIVFVSKPKFLGEKIDINGTGNAFLYDE